MAETISLAQLKAAFGTYVGTNQKDILRLLTQPTYSETFMTTKQSQDLVYRASKAVISDLVQGFQEGWTPKGKAAFTPVEILQRRHKIDLSFYPDEIMDSWLGFMGDESIDRKVWPITRYIIEQLIMPKVMDNRELALIGKGHLICKFLCGKLLFQLFILKGHRSELVVDLLNLIIGQLL